MTDPDPRRVLLIGASRGLGLGLARELAQRGWHVTGTTRGPGRTAFHDLADASAGQVTVEQADITSPEELTGLAGRLGGAEFDLLFVNAGVTIDDVPAEEVSTEDFSRVMVTNALGPMRAIAALAPLVKARGTIGVMSSRQGSIGCNTRGGQEVYRASKSALNQLMRSYAARGSDRTLLLIHPGWVQTDLGADGAPLTVEDSVPGVADVLDRHAGDPGLQFLDYQDHALPW